MLYYMYNDVDEIVGFKYNLEEYSYIKNIQGDIIGIKDSSNNTIVRYEYDAYGNIIKITDNEGNNITDINHIGNINPYRYRSYYYDIETNLYYLNSRYYNPVWGRFINSDGIINSNEDILSHNLYIYCGNNPIMYSDPSGEFAVTATIASIAKIVTLCVAAYPSVKRLTEVAVTGVANLRKPEITRDSNLGKQKLAQAKARSQSLALGLTNVKSLEVGNDYTPNKPCTTATINRITNNVDRGERLTLDETILWVKAKHDAMCDYRSDAYIVAKSVGGASAYEDHVHGNGALGYYNHFHNNHQPNHQHIWYLIFN